MYVKEYFHNIQCDCCNALANDELWHVDEEGAKEDADESGWYTLGGNHYCPNCVKIDDDDNIITADGKVWNGDTYELIRCLKPVKKTVYINVYIYDGGLTSHSCHYESEEQAIANRPRCSNIKAINTVKLEWEEGYEENL